eukprot:SAG11_NODE_2197_length_3698_cov_90.720478_1_plen_76_part_00
MVWNVRAIAVTVIAIREPIVIEGAQTVAIVTPELSLVNLVRLSNSRAQQAAAKIISNIAVGCVTELAFGFSCVVG